jgi:ferritin-like metal-binding protein YciE
VDVEENKTARLERVYLEQLSDIRAAERQAYDLLPRMATAADREDVITLLRAAASETEVQLARLDRLIEGLGLRLDDGAEAPAELLDEARRMLEGDRGDAEDVDGALLRSARRSLRYQISGYESACATARRLGDFRTLDVLLLSLDEELATDSSLSDVVARRSRLLRAI